MKKINIIILIIALIGLFLADAVMAEPFFGIEDFNKAQYAQDEIIIKFKGAKEHFQVIKVPEGQVKERIKEYLERRDIEYAEPNYIAYTSMIPNDPYYSYQWHLNNGINVEKAWDISTGSGVIVAVLDTGIAYENYGWTYKQASDLAGTCFVSGYDFVNNDSHPNDDSDPGHGTHVAGTIAQSTNNNLGVAGIAFDSCLMPVKVLNRNGSGTYSDVADGIYWAVDHGAQVINLSLGGSSSSQTLENAVAYAYNHGVTVVAAAGNDDLNTIDYPAAYDDYVIAVGAIQYNKSLAPYSNHGSSLDLVAPGGNLDLDQNNDGYGDGILQQSYKGTSWRAQFGYYFMQGTSMAAPHVSGVAALVIANGNAITPDNVRSALEKTAKDLGLVGRDNTYGWGLVDAYEALNWGGVVVPNCITSSDCNDGLVCTDDACINGDCVYTANNSNCPSDGWFDTNNKRWISISQCREKEQEEREYRDYYCSLTLDCQYNITNNQWIDTGLERNKANGTSCDDGQFCTIGETCQSGTCISGPDRDCSDSEFCTIDSCNDDLNICLSTWPSCGINDGCCGPECNYINDPDCSAGAICWSGDNEYLYRNRNQMRKFCKCAQGDYGYNNYRYVFGRETVYQYVNSGDNENWGVNSRSSYVPVYEVICSDSKVYPTNQDYFWPK